MLRKKKLDDALTYLKKKVKTDDIAQVHREIGRVYLFKRDYPQAIEALRQAAQKSKGTTRLVKADTYVLLGRALAISDDHRNAIEAFKNGIEIAGSYPSAYYYLGLSLKAQGKTGAAREAFQRAAKLEPSSSIGKKAAAQASSL
jgi:tetratricopeptide (TPR) repeat protein